MLPMRPGLPERRTHDYRRHGTTSLFAALDVATGEVLGRCFPRHRAVEFRRFLDDIAKAVPEGLEIHLVLDNYGTYKTAMIHDWLAGWQAALPPALHAYKRILDQPGRTVVRDDYLTADPAQHAPQHRGAGAGGGDRGVLDGPQREPKAVHLDQERRPDPRVTLTQDVLRTVF